MNKRQLAMVEMRLFKSCKSGDIAQKFHISKQHLYRVINKYHRRFIEWVEAEEIRACQIRVERTALIQEDPFLLCLGYPIKNQLKKNGIRRLEDITQYSIAELRSMRGVGMTSIKKIMILLEFKGLSLRK